MPPKYIIYCVYLYIIGPKCNHVVLFMNSLADKAFLLLYEGIILKFNLSSLLKVIIDPSKAMDQPVR